MTMSNETKFRGWVANLSNGETVFETIPTPGEMSSWQKLLARLRNEEGLKITRLRVMRGGITLHSLSSKSCDGFFHAYESIKAVFSGEEIMAQGVGSVIGDQIFIVWITNQGDVKADVRSLSSSRIHTTL